MTRPLDTTGAIRHSCLVPGPVPMVFRWLYHSRYRANTGRYTHSCLVKTCVNPGINRMPTSHPHRVMAAGTPGRFALRIRRCTGGVPVGVPLPLSLRATGRERQAGTDHSPLASVAAAGVQAVRGARSCTARQLASGVLAALTRGCRRAQAERHGGRYGSSGSAQTADRTRAAVLDAPGVVIPHTVGAGAATWRTGTRVEELDRAERRRASSQRQSRCRMSAGRTAGRLSVSGRRVVQVVSRRRVLRWNRGIAGSPRAVPPDSGTCLPHDSARRGPPGGVGIRGRRSVRSYCNDVTYRISASRSACDSCETLPWVSLITWIWLVASAGLI